MKILKKVLDLFSNKSAIEQEDKNYKIGSFSINNQTVNIPKSKFKQFEKQDEQILQEIRELEANNKAWSNDFNKIMKYRNEAKELEKEGRKEEALNLYLTSLKISKKSKHLQYGNYYTDIHRIIILYTKLKLNEDLKSFLEYIIEEYGEDEDWKIRLSRLAKVPEKKLSTLRKEDISILLADSPTIWEEINSLKEKLPEFNFYHDLPEGTSTLLYQNNVPSKSTQELKRLRDNFDIHTSNAKLAEIEGDYKKAIEMYEKMLLEKCENSIPYERLIIIYSKLNWIDKQIYTLQRAIIFFEYLKKKQQEYVYLLANKYGMLAKAEEYISQDKKIFYYLGAFELYNPQTSKFKKWHTLLAKITT